MVVAAYVVTTNSPAIMTADIVGLARGPDGCIYGSNIIGMHLFRFDPRARRLTDLGRVGWDGAEIYNLIAHGGKLYMGSYGGAIWGVYDPQRPWNPRPETRGTAEDANPRCLGSLGDDQNRRGERLWMTLQEREAVLMVSVVGVDVRIEGARIDECRYRPHSSRRISSMRSETSLRPLAPAPAASRRRSRRPPRCVSIAWRVSSEMVIPRRFASSRSRTSTSSGNLIVVRFMYASIPFRESCAQAAESRRAVRITTGWGHSRLQPGSAAGRPTRQVSGAPTTRAAS